MLPKGHEKLSEEEFNEMMEQHYYELDMKAGDGSLGRMNVKVSNVSNLSGVKVFNFEGKDSKYQESTTPEKKQDHGLAIDK